MKTSRVLHVMMAFLLTGAILACSFVTTMFTGETEKSSEQSTTGDEGESGQSTTGGEGESQESSTGGEGSLEPIVGTWKQIPFQGVGGRSNVYMGDSGVWFGDYYYTGTVNVVNAPVIPGEGTGGSSDAQPPQPMGPETGSGVGQPPAGAGQPFAGQQPASSKTGAEIWRTRDGTRWEVVGEPGLGNPEYTTFQTMLYKNRMYVFTATKAALLVSRDGQTFETVDGEWSDGDVRGMLAPYMFGDSLFVTGWSALKGMRAWLTTDGVRFDSVKADFLGDPAYQTMCGYGTPVAFNSWYYMGIRNVATGGEVWRTKDGSAWWTVPGAPDEDPLYTVACLTLDHDGYLYFQYVANYEPDPERGVDVFRTADGENWGKVIENGFGLGQEEGASGGFGVYKNRLYFVLENGFNATATGAKGFRLWQSLDGKTWEQVGEPGFGYAGSDQATLRIIRDMFYLVARNTKEGNRVWRSTDGTNWELFFTFPANQTNYGHHLAEIADGLEYFEYDMTKGVQIWRYGP